MQRRVDGSVAQADEGSANVILSSVTTVGEDVASTLSESISNIFNSISSDGSMTLSKSSSDQIANNSVVPKKNSNLQVCFFFFNSLLIYLMLCAIKFLCLGLCLMFIIFKLLYLLALESHVCTGIKVVSIFYPNPILTVKESYNQLS